MKDKYFLARGSYIIQLNPIRAGTVKYLKDCKWSSYTAYVYEKDDLLIDEGSIYKGLLNKGKRMKEEV